MPDVNMSGRESDGQKEQLGMPCQGEHDGVLRPVMQRGKGLEVVLDVAARVPGNLNASVAAGHSEVLVEDGTEFDVQYSELSLS